jgi:hypothetical protein
MFLPSGYAKANKERTEANAYATMMELETTMRDMNAQVQWMDPDSVVGRGAPFDDVYFVDTANLANKATQDVKDVYQMVADTLFEDFASADFANRKRSVAVNQQQHKLGPLQSARAGRALRRHAPVLFEGVFGLRPVRARHPAKPARRHPRL